MNLQRRCYQTRLLSNTTQLQVSTCSVWLVPAVAVPYLQLTLILYYFYLSHLYTFCSFLAVLEAEVKLEPDQTVDNLNPEGKSIFIWAGVMSLPQVGVASLQKFFFVGLSLCRRCLSTPVSLQSLSASFFLIRSFSL